MEKPAGGQAQCLWDSYLTLTREGVPVIVTSYAAYRFFTSIFFVAFLFVAVFLFVAKQSLSQSATNFQSKG